MLEFPLPQDSSRGGRGGWATTDPIEVFRIVFEGCFLRGVLGVISGVLQGFGPRLGRLLGRPGRQVGPSWGVLEAHGPQLGGQNPANTFKNRCQDVFRLGVHC